jgi:hypothetical protein
VCLSITLLYRLRYSPALANFRHRHSGQTHPRPRRTLRSTNRNTLPPLPSTSFIAPLPEVINALGEGPTPPGSPALLIEDTIKREQSPSPDNLSLLANVAQVAERENLHEDLPSIVTYIRSPTPDLQYPSPAPLPIPPPAPPVSPPVRPAAPVPRPASAVGFLRITTPDLQPLVPPPHALSDSPIDYEAAALRVEQRQPTPVIPEPIEDQENRPPIPVIHPPLSRTRSFIWFSELRSLSLDMIRWLVT